MNNKLHNSILVIIISIFVLTAPDYASASFAGISPTLTATSSCSTGLSCGLIGYWTFDGKDVPNGVARDVIGVSNGNLNNIATSTFYTTGKTGQAFNFDGVNDYVESGNDSSLQISNGTISAWIKTTGAGSSFRGVVVKQGGYSMFLGGNVCADNVLGLYDWGASVNRCSSASSLADNKWHHLVITFQSGVANGTTFYVDGVSAGSVTMTISSQTNNSACNNSSSNRLSIGSNCGSIASQSYKGLVDDVRVYNRTLSAGEVRKLYYISSSTKQASSPPVNATTSCTTGLSCGLAGYWTFDGKDTPNGVARDIAGGNNGNLINIATSTFYSPGKIGQAFNFDRVNDYVKVSQGSGTNLNLSTFSAITVTGWARTNETSGTLQGFVGTGNPFNTNGKGFNLLYGYPAASRWGITINDGNGSGPATSFAGSVMTKNWAFISYVLTSTTATFYMNGVSIGSLDISSEGIANLGNSNLIIGNYSNAVSAPWNGQIDDVRIYNRSLTAGEIYELYSMGR